MGSLPCAPYWALVAATVAAGGHSYLAPVARADVQEPVASGGRLSSDVPAERGRPDESVESLGPARDVEPPTASEPSGLSVSVSAPRSPPDAPSPRYWQLVDEALAARSAGRFQDAFERMRAAHGLEPSARSLRALGVLCFDLGRAPDAVRYLEAALASPIRALDGALRSATEELHSTVRRSVAELVVVSSPSTSSVSVDALTRQLSPVYVVPGVHSVEVHALGHRPSAQRVTVAAGERIVVNMELAPEKSVDAEEGAAARARRRWWWAGVAALAAAGAVSAGLSFANRSAPYSGGNTGIVVGR